MLFSSQLVDRLLWMSLDSIVNALRVEKLGLRPISSMEYGWDLVNRNKVPFAKMWSTALAPKPKDWGDHIDIVGFFTEPQKPMNSFTPPPHLGRFLCQRDDDGRRTVFVGFGSMVIDNTETVVRSIVEAAALAGVRIIFQTGWSEISALTFNAIVQDAAKAARLVREADVEEDSGGELVSDVIEWTAADACLIGPCPHDWLFAHVDAVIHHGGAGTTCAGLRAGCTTFICPFFGDQFFWGQIVHQMGAGPKACSVTLLTTAVVVDVMMVLVAEPTRRKAMEISKVLQSENGVEGGLKCFYEHLPLNDMICEVCAQHGVCHLARVTCSRCGLNMCSEAAHVFHVHCEECTGSIDFIVGADCEGDAAILSRCKYVRWNGAGVRGADSSHDQDSNDHGGAGAAAGGASASGGVAGVHITGSGGGGGGAGGALGCAASTRDMVRSAVSWTGAQQFLVQLIHGASRLDLGRLIRPDIFQSAKRHIGWSSANAEAAVADSGYLRDHHHGHHASKSDGAEAQQSTPTGKGEKNGSALSCSVIMNEGEASCCRMHCWMTVLFIIISRLLSRPLPPSSLSSSSSLLLWLLSSSSLSSSSSWSTTN